MLMTLRIYNIFFWNSSLKEKLDGTKLVIFQVVKRSKPLIPKAEAKQFKIKKNNDEKGKN